MGRTHELQRRISSLQEIADIVDSMHNLATMEMHKLERSSSAQRRVVASITRALDEVRHHYLSAPPAVEVTPVYIVFGSERGFCGAYNEQLTAHLLQQPAHDRAPVVGVGSRLEGPLASRCPQAICLPGAAVVDEVDAVLGNLVATVNRLGRDHLPSQLQVIQFRADSHAVVCEPVLPPARDGAAGGVAPRLNLPPRQLLQELLQHYLFAVTHAWFFSALMAENQRRVQHLQQAGDHLERRLDQLHKRRNVIRQEEIIEEIEVILLSAESIGPLGT